MADLAGRNKALVAWFLLGAAVVLLVTPSTGARADEAAWRALAEPGTAVLMRHAEAPGVGDPPGLRLDDCTTQRNLSEHGRVQARAAGTAIRARGIAVDRVMTSQWCRCRETAELLALGPVQGLSALDSFFGDRGRAAGQTQAVVAFLAEHAVSEKLVLVTHQVNISALTGLHPASGEIVVVAAGGDGLVVRGQLLIRE